MNKKHFTAPIVVKSLDEGGHFEGYASVFGVVDSDGDVIVKGAFKNSIERYAKTGKRPKMLWQHDRREIVGKFLELREDDVGLFVSGTLIMEVQRGAEAYALLKAGELDAMSVGFNITGEDETIDTMGRGRVITDLDLWEISLVTWGANPEAKVSNVKTIKDFERLLRDAGFSRTQSTAIASRGYKAAMSQGDLDENSELLSSIEQLTKKLKGITHG